jgi:molybdopterin molybdotransferase
MSSSGGVRRQVTRDELDAPLLDYDEAVVRVADAFTPLAPRRVHLADALGLVLAEQVVAADDIPSFENSAMDGYAVRSADLVGATSELVISDEPGPGAAVKIMTGQPIPDGADAIVPWERTRPVGSEHVQIDGAVEPGRFVRPRGEDVRRGDLVLAARTVLGPVEVGMAAAMGCAELLVHPRPRVGVLSTGDELVGVDEPVGRGHVRDANGPLLAATVTALGGEVAALERVPDDPELIASALHRLAAVSDLVVTSGGASVGEKDWLRVLLEREGTLTFWRIAMRPGKPVALGRVDDTPVVVLPGNPGSVVACSHVVLGRALRRLAGAPAEPRSVPTRLAEDIVGDEQRTVVHPVRLRSGSASPAQVRSSQVLSNALGLDGWVIVPPGGVTAGTTVQVELP